MYPAEYIKFLVHFHGDRDYFECHEILEEYWKSTDKNNKSSVWVGLILMAVSFYHHRRGNCNGAVRTLRKGISILKNRPHELKGLGLDAARLTSNLTERLTLIKNGGNYTSYNLPIADSKLRLQCAEMCSRQGFTWCNSSNLMNDELVHRHKKRDRSMIIQERLKALHKNN